MRHLNTDMENKRAYSDMIIRFLKELKKSYIINGPVFKQAKFIFDYFKYNKNINKGPLDWQMPWTTIESIKFIQSKLNSEMKVFEYGTGGSTLFFCKSVYEIYSIEHDENWFEYLINKAEIKELRNLEISLVKPSIIKEPEFYETKHEKRFFGYNFYNYVNSINKFPNDHFDIIMIDGRARPYCLKKSFLKLKPGGYLIFDNCNRTYYKSVLDQFEDNLVLKSYGPTLSNERFTFTNIYRKSIN